ncbi:MAG: Coenzyme F420 hydrogenase/dehydrogenase, beta subunit C-terminal domain [Kiritimatiellae bacterium]|nr:Coenzyme F420 hydrogenase/dehydrogenase, beta subunit C-terminal domain [Kiritimatiellia bacterium]
MTGFEPRMPLACFAARTRDEAVLKASSSGGVFTELARYVLAKGGVVAGAAWDRKTWQVEHRVVRDEAGLAELRGSKYVYSRFSGVFGELEACLAEGRPVLFSGVPCQVAAARRRLHDAEGLLTCGVICHSGIDEKIWLRYVAEVESKAKSRLKDVRFRDKSKGWRRRSWVVLEFENPRRNVSMWLDQCPYVRAFLQGYAAREACLSCRFRSGRAGMDIQLGDFWGIGKHLPAWNDGRGASAVLVYSERGLAAWNALDLEKTRVEYSQILGGNPMLEQCASPDLRKRARFLESFAARGVSTACRLAEDGCWPRHAVLETWRWIHRQGGRVKRLLFGRSP